MEKKKWAGWIILTVIVLVAAVALAVTNMVTKESIDSQGLSASEEALKKMFPEADQMEPMQPAANSGLDLAYEIKKAGEVIGHAGAVKVQGYAGLIEVTVGVAPDGTLKGIAVGGTEFKETEGLGSKVRAADFTGLFAGKKPPLTLGTDVDAISGATISSRAVVDGVNSAYEKLMTLTGLGPGATGGPADTGSPSATQADKIISASVIGYGGPVLVQLGLDSDGAIQAITVGAERFLETEGIGSKVKDPAFTEQFIGKKAPLTLNDVDAVAGATVSSQAVVDAVNAAYAFLNE